MPIKYWIRTRRTLVLFLGIMGIFVAGAGWLGWNFLRQDKELEEQRIRERLDNTADVVVAELRAAYSRFEQQLETLATLEPADIPEAARAGSAELPADIVIVHVTGVGVTAYPPERVLYYPMLPTGAELPPGTFAEGEDFEVGGRYEEAIASFQRLATADDPATRFLTLPPVLGRPYRGGDLRVASAAPCSARRGVEDRDRIPLISRAGLGGLDRRFRHGSHS